MPDYTGHIATGYELTGLSWVTATFERDGQPFLQLEGELAITATYPTREEIMVALAPPAAQLGYRVEPFGDGNSMELRPLR